MREQYERTRRASRPSGRDYFETNGSGSGRNGDRQPPRPQQKVAPRASRRRSPPPKAAGRSRRPERAAGGEDRPRADARAQGRPPRPAAEAAEPAKGTTTPVAKDAPPAAPSAASDEPTLHRAARRPRPTAQNMDASLDACRPRPRSARCPVKLLWDNRTVINNHLARARGGKVSLHPPDRLRAGQGAARDAGDERRLRRDRRQAQPDHPGAHQPRPGHRHARSPTAPASCSCPSIKAAETMDFAAFWTAYEEHRPQGARQQARRRGLPGHHHLADQPRHASAPTTRCRG